jgi:hypothetical protein
MLRNCISITLCPIHNFKWITRLVLSRLNIVNLHNVKRTARKYFSSLLLICLAVQLAPYGLFHSHDEHHATECVHLDSNDHVDHNDHSQSISLDQNSSDYQFSSLEDCDFCEILHALNDQSYLLNGQKAVKVAIVDSQSSVDLHVSLIEEQASSIRGRAPPKA